MDLIETGEQNINTMENPEAKIMVGVATVIALLAGRLKGMRRKPIRGYLDLTELTENRKQQVEKIRRDFLPRVADIRRALRKRGSN